MLVVTSFMRIPMCHIFLYIILVTWELGRILVIFYVMLSLPSPGLTMGIG
jgi:hypothetical protein